MAAELNQPQTDFSLCLDYKPQPELMKLIFNWVKDLPAAPVTIIDLAGGYGIEAKELALKGIVCASQDASWSMINGAVSKVNYGCAEELDGYPEGNFGGALLKDAWVFLSPSQRQKMLQGLQRILVPGGSLLIASEVKDSFRISYLSRNSQGVSRESLTCQSLAELETNFFQLAKNKDACIQTIFYTSTAADTKAYAERLGFSCKILAEYNTSNIMARENRWSNDAGFIAKLTKSA